MRRRKKKSNMLKDNRIKSCLSRFDSGAYSRLQFLRAVSQSVGAHAESLQPRVDNGSNTSSSEDEDRQAPVQEAPTSGASESATAAAATTSDDCCKVHRGATCWLRTGAVRTYNTLTLYKTTQWWQRKLLEIDLSVNHTINHYFIVRPNESRELANLVCHTSQ